MSPTEPLVLPSPTPISTTTGRRPLLDTLTAMVMRMSTSGLHTPTTTGRTWTPVHPPSVSVKDTFITTTSLITMTVGFYHYWKSWIFVEQLLSHRYQHSWWCSAPCREQRLRWTGQAIVLHRWGIRSRYRKRLRWRREHRPRGYLDLGSLHLWSPRVHWSRVRRHLRSRCYSQLVNGFRLRAQNKGASYYTYTNSVFLLFQRYSFFFM